MTQLSSPATLSGRLRADTKDAHVRAERSGVMRRVLRGQIDRPTYVALLVDLATIYDALERELDRHAAHPAIAPFALGTLRRHATLRADIASLTEHAPPPDRVALAYAEHLHALGTSTPVRLLAHAYVRYMGDLSGGQILRGIVARALGLDEGAGTTFYDFTEVGDPSALKAHFRDAVDALPPNVADPIVDEALHAFDLHEQLFTALDAPR